MYSTFVSPSSQSAHVEEVFTTDVSSFYTSPGLMSATSTLSFSQSDVIPFHDAVTLSTQVLTYLVPRTSDLVNIALENTFAQSINTNLIRIY